MMFHSSNQRSKRDLVLAVLSALCFLSLLSSIIIANFAGVVAAASKDDGSISHHGHLSAPTAASTIAPVRKRFLRRGDNGATFPSPPRALVEDRIGDSTNTIDDLGDDCIVIQHQERDEVEFQCRSKPTDDETIVTSLDADDEISFDVKVDQDRGLVIKLGLGYAHRVSIMGSSGTESSSTTPTMEPKDGKEGENKSSSTQEYYEISFDRIIEYEKKSQEAVVVEGSSSSSSSSYYEEAYDWSTTNKVVNEISLLEWSDISPVVIERESDDGTPSASSRPSSSTFSATTKDGILTISFTISQTTTIGTPDVEKAAVTGSSATAANKIKFDFEIKNFPWSRNNTNVALISHISTAQAVDIDYGKTIGGKEDEDSDGDDAPNDGKDTTAGFNGTSEQTPSSSNKLSWVMFVSGSVDSTIVGEATPGVQVSPFGEFTWAETAITRWLENDDDNSVDASGVEEDASDVNTVMTLSTASSSTVNEEDMKSRIVGVVATCAPLTEQGKDTTESMSGVPMMIEQQTIAFSFVGSAAHSAEDLVWNLEAGVGYIIAPSGLDGAGMAGGSGEANRDSSRNAGHGNIWVVFISLVVLAVFYFLTMLSTSAKRGHHSH